MAVTVALSVAAGVVDVGVGVGVVGVGVGVGVVGVGVGAGVDLVRVGLGLLTGCVVTGVGDVVRDGLIVGRADRDVAGVVPTTAP